MRSENIVRCVLLVAGATFVLIACGGPQTDPGSAPVAQGEAPRDAIVSDGPALEPPEAEVDGAAEPVPEDSTSPLPAGARVIASRPTVEGGLGEDAVADTVASAHGQFEACYAAELFRDPDASGRIRVRFRIDEQGTPGSDHITGSMGAPALESCVTEALMALRFPAASSDSSVSCPFLFEPPGAAE